MMSRNKRPPVPFLRPDAFKLTYGITKEDYNKLIEKQSSCCALCKKHMINFKNRLLVDKSGDEVKGLLCPSCLETMKYIRDNASNVIEYIKEEN
jgi:hypothetical protein